MIDAIEAISATDATINASEPPPNMDAGNFSLSFSVLEESLSSGSPTLLAPITILGIASYMLSYNARSSLFAHRTHRLLPTLQHTGDMEKILFLYLNIFYTNSPFKIKVYKFFALRSYFTIPSVTNALQIKKGVCNLAHP